MTLDNSLFAVKYKWEAKLFRKLSLVSGKIHTHSDKHVSHLKDSTSTPLTHVVEYTHMNVIYQSTVNELPQMNTNASLKRNH